MPNTLLAPALQVLASPTPFGWLAAAFGEGRCREIRFGHAAESAAVRALEGEPGEVFSPRTARRDSALGRFLTALEAFCAGDAEPPFDAVELDLEHLTPFQQRIVECCRGIPFGDTLSYGELAAAAGRPRAARAVGNTMARNRFPLVVPCHRVVGASGRLTGFSAPGGVSTKERLLAHEAAARRAREGSGAN